MLDLMIEKEMPLTTQEQYEIINTALELANDKGFLSQFVFEHALWCLVVEKLVDDVPEEIANIIRQNPIQAWDQMLKNGFLEELFKNYNQPIDLVIEGTPQQTSVLEYFSQAAFQYYLDYRDYLLSLGGALSQTDMMSTDNLNNFTKQLQEFMSNDNTLKTLEIADDWGMNNTPEKKEKPKIKLVEDLPEDSLFK